MNKKPTQVDLFQKTQKFKDIERLLKNHSIDIHEYSEYHLQIAMLCARRASMQVIAQQIELNNDHEKQKKELLKYIEENRREGLDPEQIEKKKPEHRSVSKEIQDLINLIQLDDDMSFEARHIATTLLKGYNKTKLDEDEKNALKETIANNDFGEDLKEMARKKLKDEVPLKLHKDEKIAASDDVFKMFYPIIKEADRAKNLYADLTLLIAGISISESTYFDRAYKFFPKDKS